MAWKRILHYWPFVRRIQIAGNAEHWFVFYCWSEQALEEKVELKMIWDTMSFMRLHCNDITICLQVAYKKIFTVDRENQKVISIKWRHICVTSSQMTANSGNGLFVQQFIQAWNKQNFKVSRHWPFMRGILWWTLDFLHKGPVMWKAFQCHGIEKLDISRACSHFGLVCMVLCALQLMCPLWSPRSRIVD